MRDGRVEGGVDGGIGGGVHCGSHVGDGDVDGVTGPGDAEDGGDLLGGGGGGVAVGAIRGGRCGGCHGGGLGWCLVMMVEVHGSGVLRLGNFCFYTGI